MKSLILVTLISSIFLVDYTQACDWEVMSFCKNEVNSHPRRTRKKKNITCIDFISRIINTNTGLVYGNIDFASEESANKFFNKNVCTQKQKATKNADILPIMQTDESGSST